MLKLGLPSFQRIISKGAFIPEIDGLRFLAIISVVLFHIHGFLQVKDLNVYHTTYTFGEGVKHLLAMGHYGVPLFFVISGFILAKPFAKSYLLGGKSVVLSQYFIRRLTRLEPPYILVMTALLFGAIYVAQTSALSEALPSYLASISYTHNLFYGKGDLPLLNCVAWSLEIEVQFYLIMPILAYIIFRQLKWVRRSLVIVSSIMFIWFDYYEKLPFISLLNYIEYFLIGILLADLYVSNEKINKPIPLPGLITLALLASLWMFDTESLDSVYKKVLWESLQLTAIFGSYYLILFHKSLKIFANPVITGIGGMCYSIYLLHYPLISIIGNPLMGVSFSGISYVNNIVYTIILLVVILLASSAFYLLVERPCMDKNWPAKLASLFSSRSRLTAAPPDSVKPTNK